MLSLMGSKARREAHKLSASSCAVIRNPRAMIPGKDCCRRCGRERERVRHLKHVPVLVFGDGAAARCGGMAMGEVDDAGLDGKDGGEEVNGYPFDSERLSVSDPQGDCRQQIPAPFSPLDPSIRRGRVKERTAREYNCQVHWIQIHGFSFISPPDSQIAHRGHL